MPPPRHYTRRIQSDLTGDRDRHEALSLCGDVSFEWFDTSWPTARLADHPDDIVTCPRCIDLLSLAVDDGVNLDNRHAVLRWHAALRETHRPIPADWP